MVMRRIQFLTLSTFLLFRPSSHATFCHTQHFVTRNILPHVTFCHTQHLVKQYYDILTHATFCHTILRYCDKKILSVKLFPASNTFIELSLINILAPTLCSWNHFQHHGHMTRTPKQNNIMLLDPL